MVDRKKGSSSERTMVRYIQAERAFEYKASEDGEPVKILERDLGKLMRGLEPMQAKVLGLLVDNARRTPGQWAEASTDDVVPGQVKV
jgi:hypothetical protein